MYMNTNPQDKKEGYSLGNCYNFELAAQRDCQDARKFGRWIIDEHESSGSLDSQAERGKTLFQRKSIKAHFPQNECG